MLGKTKNFLFNLCKKKTILFVFFFSFFGLIFARSVSANWVLDIIFGIPFKTVLLIMWLITQFTIFLTSLCGKLLNWVLSPGFIKFSYTKPGPTAPDNPIIETGLGVTQGFVNMLLVLILVYIAIATILRLAGYETKKLLVTFIVVALLVNFAPVICGLIVDASNIVMNFFIQDLGTDAFGAKMAKQVSDMMFDWKNATWEKSGQSVLQLYILNGFLFILSFILLLFTLIFILRYLVIWILVILSPLAFACYILPITRKYWDLWWKQFINWSFIGVSCGFFLYLGLLFVTHVPAAIPAPTTGQGGLFDPILPYFVSVVFLGIGLVFGLQTSAMGAGSVINIAKTKGRAVVRGAGKGARLAGRGMGWTAEKTRAKMPEKVTRWAEKWRAESKWGKGEIGLKGLTKRALATALPLRYAMRGVGRVVAGKAIEDEQNRIKKTEKDLKDKRIQTKLERYNLALTDTEKIGAINSMIEEGQIDDAMNEKKFGRAAIKKDEMKRIIKKAKKLDSDKSLKKALPHLAAELVTNDELAEAKKKDERIDTKEKLVISRLKPDDYKNISGEALKNRNVVDAMLSTSMGKHISQLIEQHGRAAANALEKEMQYKAYETNKTPDNWLRDINPKLHRYFGVSAGAGLISIPDKAATPPEIEKKIEKEKERLRTIGQKIREEGVETSEKLKTMKQKIKEKKEKK